ncbi:MULTISPECIES: FixH family protein [Bacillaceae]|uniref:FixH family protein n=1 Tax=Bacillaceae TaxID=186817 RepID=UPI00159BCCD7|nr:MULTISPECIES: FixH family protein [Bacillaceae]UGB32172.1 FixH family protein [Metabacillus sp. B2-18]
MRKLTNMIMTSFLFFFVSACQSPSSHHEHMKGQEEFLDVSVKLNPKEIEAGVSFSIQLHITQMDNDINHADDVRIDVWKDGEESEKETYEATYDGKGMYVVDLMLEESGSYKVMYHVTAKEQHVMNEVPLTVQEGN